MTTPRNLNSLLGINVSPENVMAKQKGPLWDALMALRDAQVAIDDIFLGERGDSLSPEETKILAITSRDILQMRGNIRNLRDSLQAARGA